MIIIKKTFLLIALIIIQQCAFAATYYVDSEHGNDLWSGQQPAPMGTNGPWQTLGRLAAAALLPGDTVYLGCGATWNETLRIGASGTRAAPIAIFAGPGTCETPPAIDGAVSIPSHMWKPYGGGIYRARLPMEYISNPGLSENVNGWAHWSPGLDASMSLDTACTGSPLPCMAFTSGAASGIAISNNFPLAGGINYSASVLVMAPAGTRMKFVIRRGGPTFESLATDQYVTGSGAWQTVNFTFRAASSAPNARFDIQVLTGKTKINLREVHVQRVLPPGGVIGAFVDGTAIRDAHHPNFGRVDTNPDSPYGTIASAGARTTVDTAGLILPANASLTPGLGISIRTQTFALEERRVAAVSGTRLTLDEATYYSIKAGYGYFLTGALWMLDSPGEWYFNPSTGDLYVWMPDETVPGNRVSFNSIAVGIDLSRKAYVDLVGLDVRRVGVGVQLREATTVRLRNMAIAELANQGVEADNSLSCTIEQSSIANTGLEAIKAVGGSTTGFNISDNNITDAGGGTRTDGWRRLTRPGKAAIIVGPNASISRNQVLRSANSGIFVEKNSTVEDNHFSRACLRYNDCGGIYAGYAGNNSSIIGNVVDDISGDFAGLPAGSPNQAVGIYLDEGGTDIQVRKNTVTNAEYGIQIHDANNSTVAENVLFGNRRYQIWMQEQTKKLRAKGDIFGNRIESNILIPNVGGPSVFMESEVGDTSDFAIFLGNHYSALISPRPVSESWPGGNASYNLADWLAKGQDAGARITQPVGYASFLTSGTNIITNGSFTNSFTGWTWWNETAPYARIAVVGCAFGPCLEVTAGASPSLLASPNFSITADQWYRVSFDAATSQAGQPINVLVRRGGGGSANYEALMPAAESFPGSSSWRRYSFVFRAPKTIIAHHPSTGEELGARIDFDRIQPGFSLRVARLEMIPLTPSQTALQLRLQLNPSGNSTNVSCAPVDEAAGRCNNFIHIKDDSVVDWSALVEPRSGNVVYTRDTALVDTDHDGIADVQDACPETWEGSGVNARGCGFDQ